MVKLEINNKLTETISVPYISQFLYSSTRLTYGVAGIITLTGEGFLQGTISVSIGSKSCTNPQFVDSKTITCTFSADVPPLTDGLDIVVSTPNGNSPGKFFYISETFSHVIQQGDILYLYGDLFTTFSKITLGLNDISTYCTVTNSSLITCSNLPNIPSGTVTITGGTISSYPFVFTPIIDSISNNLFPTTGEKITITGKYFELAVGQPSQTLSIIFDSAQSFTTFTLKSSSIIEFTIPSGKGRDHLLALKQTSFVSNSIGFSYLPPTITITDVNQIDDTITIIGTGFSYDISTTTIFISTQELTPNCNINSDTEIVCSTIPLYILSGKIEVSNKLTKSNSFTFYFKPYIISLSTPILDTAGGETITISGRFFETVDPITNSNNNFKLLSDGIHQLSISQIDGTTIIAKSISGYGKNHYFVAQSNSRISNQVQYSFAPPFITGFTQINENQFSIQAQQFSIDQVSLNRVILNDLETAPSISQDRKSLVITVDGKTSNGQISLNVAGQLSNILPIFFTPVIKSLSFKPYLDGSSVVTINGLYFSNKNYQTNSQVDLSFSYVLDSAPNTLSILECTYINGESASCKGFNGYGNAKLLLIKIDNSTPYSSNNITFSFQEPKVIKSTSLFYNAPGNITITAESFLSNSLEVYVSNVSCSNPVAIDNNHIRCFYDASVPPNQDQTSLTISILSNNMLGKNQVFYYYEPLKCPNNCSSDQGVCNPINGNCACKEGFDGIDCSIPKQKPLPPPIVDGNGNSIISGGTLNFTVSIVYLRELDISSSPVKTLSMSNVQWDNKTRSNSTDSYYKGTFENDTATIELDVTYYKDAYEYDFAGDIVSIPSNSIKYVITISNWQFESPLNTLQVIYNSKTKKYYDDGCNVYQASSNSGGSTNESVSWFQLVSGGSVMDAKFSRRMFVDDTVRKSEVSVLPIDDPLYLLLNTNDEYYNRLTSINTPFFSQRVVLDPSFNSIIRTSSDNKCENKWKVPVVASVCAAGGVALIAGVSGVLRSKYKNRIFQKNFAKKMNTL
ncbi:hypothetical protein DICPUDRAFT_34543 [Dictyostelium purpureum]|uniref:EGF-like domain-containing protein n=1 Tax=Dictyostelium purpureum TaxID=5786 RepID=F0ZMW3_DICPU|nr:uncharacterized protein DICPUDRAFT_34543 [Dictyostelium purpureum]EGC34711.1 hypothetical protein DICPUDRAFT_34543 [Dictyostelium purpureum]|eukprot:XP_003288752.1 hypothetical protein DICPUDRAFT_34543 [Dictyostelium purpureum]